MVGRAGRKRKLGTRYASGDLIPQPRMSRELIAAMQPHRRWLPESLRTHPKAESYFGQLNLIGALTDDQYEAGRRFADVVMKYRTVIGAPKAHPSSVSGEFVRGSVGLDETECAARKQAYEWAVESFAKVELDGKRTPGNSQLAMKAVSRVAVYNEDCPTSVDYLLAGLDSLARHFGIKTNATPFVFTGLMTFEKERVIAY